MWAEKMKLTIKSKDYPMTPELENYVRDQIGEKLNSYSDRIANVKVSLKTVRQPNDMLDTQCCIEARVKSVQTVVVIKRSHDARSTIRLCVDQTALAVSRALSNYQYKRFRRSMGRLQPMRDGLRIVAA